MYRVTQDFLVDWTHESDSTFRLLSCLTDESLDQRVVEGGRTIRDLAWHIVKTIPEMFGAAGLVVEGPAQDVPAPATAAEIVEAYKVAAGSIAVQVVGEWSDAKLAEPVQMYGQTWTYGLTLSIFLKHEVHHRAQLTVLMRQAGLVIPGMYGPAKEEWAAIGMSPMQ